MFRLVKWYGDCVSAEGEAVIGYWAELRWRRLHVRYAAKIEARAGSGARTVTTLRSGNPPAGEGDVYRWREPLLDIEAEWRRAAPAYEALLYGDAGGEVRWHCVAPAARVEVRRGNGAVLRGFGYLERLETSVAPWALPIETLHWGRYVAEAESLVWIDWRGAHACRLVLRDGCLADATDVESSRITLAGGARCEIAAGLTLREGRLGPGALSVLAGLKRLLPARILGVHEHKWLSRAAMSGAGVSSEGWAIHEVVTWPAARGH